MDGSGKRGAKMMANDRMFRAIVGDEPLQFLAEAEQTMAMSAVAKRWTGSEVRALIEANPLHTPRYELIDGESLAQPDVFVIPPLPVPRPRKTRQLKKLLLAIEVISPSSARGDRVKKRTYCTRNRVPQYWVVDLDARVFERSMPGEPRPQVLTDSITWHPVGAVGPLTIDLPKFFRDVLGEAVPTE